MAIISIKNAKPYSTHAKALNDVFGFDYKQHVKASKAISKTQWVVFFNLAEEDANGVWKPPRKNVNWLNIPAKDGSAFAQIELNKKDDSYFENVNPVYNNAVFMWRKGKNNKYAYYFYGIFKRTCVNEEIGLSIYERSAIKLNTDEWKPKKPVRKKSAIRKIKKK